VEVLLNVRGICSLRPGVPGLSENVTVVSIVDRFLEHSRILCFHRGGDPAVFLSSADWMPRNLDRRIELLVPVEDPAGRDRLLSVLEACFQDNVKARRLLPDGAYERVRAKGKKSAVRAQETLYRDACERARLEESRAPKTFEPLGPAA
jgi:polyphosphate kinase